MQNVFPKTTITSYYLTLLIKYSSPLMPGGNKKVTHTWVCLSMCDFFVTTRHQRPRNTIQTKLNSHIYIQSKEIRAPQEYRTTAEAF